MREVAGLAEPNPPPLVIAGFEQKGARAGFLRGV
jgi:hypothetical protein